MVQLGNIIVGAKRCIFAPVLHRHRVVGGWVEGARIDGELRQMSCSVPMLAALVLLQPTASGAFSLNRFLAKLGRTIHLDGCPEEESN